jgi:hypothetical protein
MISPPHNRLCRLAVAALVCFGHSQHHSELLQCYLGVARSDETGKGGRRLLLLPQYLFPGIPIRNPMPQLPLEMLSPVL